jgi:hypothetical protein
MAEPNYNQPGPTTLSAGDVRGLRALLQIANDTSCAPATRDLARLGLAGYPSTILGEPPVIEDGGACEEADSSGGELTGLDGGNPA